jgi:hypothetical protein
MSNNNKFATDEQMAQLDKASGFNYSKINNGGMLMGMLGDDGMLWAIACKQFYKKHLDQDIEKLVEDSMILEALRAQGVDNWEGYGEALAQLDDDRKDFPNKLQGMQEKA